VLWQPWVWTWWPESRWISSTYEETLARDLSELSMQLVKSEWYQERWPIELIKDAASNWKNAKGGIRRAVGIGGAITGKHAHFHIGDDLIKEQLSRLGTPSQIAAAIRKAVDFWFTTMATRETGKATARVLIGQRLGVDDPPGVAERDHSYEMMSFPARFEPERADRRDHRKVPGEVLCEERRDDAGWRELEKTIGPLAARAQLQQDPAPLGGRILHDEYLVHRYVELPNELRRTRNENRVGRGQRWGIFGDLGFKGKEGHSRVALQVWAWFLAKAWLIDAVVEHVGFLGSLTMIRDLRAAYPFITEVCLEDAANAPACVETLKDEIPGLVLEPMGGGTLARTQSKTGLWAAGSVMLPIDAPFMGGSQGFIAEHAGFDGMKTRPDDQVSASSLALVHFTSGNSDGPAWAKAMNRIKGR